MRPFFSVISIFFRIGNSCEGKTNKLRKKRKFQETCDIPLVEVAVSSKSNEDDAVTTTSDLFHFDSLEF